MFKQNKWEAWYDSLPAHTRVWLKSQPIYTAKDYDKVIVIAFVVGVLIGLLF